jgi:two-component system nitrogen regulation response regulator GlnG
MSAQVHSTKRSDPLPGYHAKASSFLGESMGSGEQISNVIADVALVAPTDFTALISGETGAGKELVAREIHRLSRRASGPFVPVDCGSIPPSLIESELFGHEKGSFTGADATRQGKFEAASGGTIFLDEISSLPLSVQPKLLRSLQEKQIWHVGGNKCIAVDIRVVAATNQDLPTLVRGGCFRRDLYHRLNEFTMTIPPLRERRDDIVFLANRFLRETNQELNKNVCGISDGALEVLLQYKWPGNVRELRNVMRRAVLSANGAVEAAGLCIAASVSCEEHFQTEQLKEFDGSVPLRVLVKRAVIRVERDVLTQVLRQTGGNKAKAARILQVDYKTIHKKTKEYGISFVIGESSDGQETREEHGQE